MAEQTTDSTLVLLSTIATDGHTEIVWCQPWDIERAQPWIVGADSNRFEGARVFLNDGADQTVIVFTAECAVEVVRRIDAARAALGALETPEQRVRVTNWMAQIWVLLLTNFLVSMFVSRWGGRVWDCLTTRALCDHPYMWLPW